MPRNLQDITSDSGASAVRSRSIFGIRTIETLSWLPGTTDRYFKLNMEATCSDQNITASTKFEYNTIGRNAAEDICRAVVKSASYIARFSSKPKNFTYQLILAEKGIETNLRSFNIAVSDHLVFRFAKPIFDSNNTTKRKAIKTIAHEATHITAIINELPANHRNEEIAYLAGYCALLYVTGTLEDLDLYQQPLNDGIGIPESALKSSTAGKTVARNIRETFGPGPIRGDAIPGKKMLITCEDQLNHFFSERHQAN